MSISVRVVDRKGRDLGTYDVQSITTFQAFKEQFAQKNRKWYPDRQYFTFNGIAIKDVEKTFEALSIGNDAQLVFKDLGPQIGYRTVFYVEYFGPILVHSLFYWLPQLFYGKTFEKNFTQQVAYALVMVHYIKRELESAFVHIFSNGTMPIFNIFKNSAHYWLLGGAFIAYFLYHPDYTAPFGDNVVIACAVVFMIAQLGNAHAHLVLRSLRSGKTEAGGNRKRGNPRGQLFELVSCANYTWEITAWTVFAIFTQTLTAYFFLVVSTAQIAIWAKKKHVSLRKEFKEPRGRKILFPFIW